MEGKLGIDGLSKLVKWRGKTNPGIIIPSMVGTDAAVFSHNKAKSIALNYYNSENEECYIVWKSDPITFPTNDPGRYAIIINLNDLACFGAIPYGVLVTWLLPVKSDIKDLNSLQQKLDSAAKEFNISILGGHTEFTNSVESVVISLTMIGYVPESYMPKRNIKPGDSIYFIGFVGNEGTAILSHEICRSQKFDDSQKSNFSNYEIFEKQLSIFNLALELNKLFKPKLLHDPTEGGVLGAIYEMVSGSGFGVKIDRNSLESHIHPMTQKICTLLSIDPLRLISSGSLLLCMEKDAMNFSQKFDTKISEIGSIISQKSFLIDNLEFGEPGPDELIKGLKSLENLESI